MINEMVHTSNYIHTVFGNNVQVCIWTPAPIGVHYAATP